MTDALGLAEKVNKFNQQALKHLESQTLNPFSGRFSRSPSPRPRFGKDEYGKPKAGSLTDLRGQKAFNHVSREILDLCNLIHDVGSRKRERGEYECDEEEDDGQIIMTFGELFAIYSKISDKVVGLLIAAKKRGFVYFEPEILFQRRDDDVLIALMKPIEEIRSIIDRQLSASPSPAAIATFNEQQDSSKSPEQPDEAQSSQPCVDPSMNESQTQPTAELSTVKEEQVPSCLPVIGVTLSNQPDETTPCQPETVPSSRKGSVSLPPTDEAPPSSTILETTSENKVSTSLPNSEPFSENKIEEAASILFASEPPSDSVEDTPSSTNNTDPPSNMDELGSTPVTESSSSMNESQSTPITQSSSNMDESESTHVTESFSNIDDSKITPVTGSSTSMNESQSTPVTESSSNIDESHINHVTESSSYIDESKSTHVTDSSTSMNESQSIPVTESSANNEEQTLSTPEPTCEKEEQLPLYPSVSAPSNNKGEQTLS